MTSQEGFLMKASQMCTDEINELRLVIFTLGDFLGLYESRISGGRFGLGVVNTHVRMNGNRYLMDCIMPSLTTQGFFLLVILYIS